MGLVADAEEEARRDVAPAPRGPPMTALAAGPLGRAGLVLVADVVAVQGGGGVQTVLVRPVRTLKGDPGGDTVRLFVGGPRPTGDARRPSVPYFAPDDDGRYVLFLVRRGRGIAWRLDTLFQVEGLVGAEKAKAVAHQAELARIPDPDERARRTLVWLLGGLSDAGTWTRVHVARELNHLVRVRPQVFDEAARARIRAAERRSRVPSQRTWLVRLLEALASTPASEPEPEPEPETACPAPGRSSGRDPDPPPARGEGALGEALLEATEPAARIAVFTRLLERGGTAGFDALFRALRKEQEAVKIGVIDLLWAGGYREATPRIRALYANEEDGAVLQAIVRAVGHLGSDQDVTWLDVRRSGLRVRREALFALARIRTPSALESLRRAAREARAAPEGSDDIVALVEYLLGSAFVEVERAAGRGVGEARRR